jgi:signal transduction histidine kinase
MGILSRALACAGYPRGVRRALRWLRARLGVRVVTALAAALSVAVVLVLAGAALVLLTDGLLRDSVQETAVQQATVVAERVEANFEDDVEKNADDATAKRGDLVQVVRNYADDGQEPNVDVIGASTPLWTVGPISTLMPEPGEVLVDRDAEVTHRDGLEPDDPEITEDALIVAYGASVKGRDVVVYAAQPLDEVHDAVETVFRLTVVGIPLLVLITGAVTYLAAGRALRPVEAIRARVAATTDDLSVRVPVPPAHDEVGRLAETMNAMLARLQAAQAAQRRFVADASHELRSPLATIATGLELLSRGNAGPDAVEALRGETARLGRLVDALLLLARADERGLTPRREDVDLDEVAQAEQRRPSVGIALRVDAVPVRVVGDRARLAQVVRNLVDNACRHARSAVVVTVRRDGAHAAVDVADDGPGVPAAERTRVFQRFVRLDDARARADGGAGLGLAIVAEVVAAHGGTVDVVDGPLGGALFRVRLPLPDDPLPEETPLADETLVDDALPDEPAPAAPRPSPVPRAGQAGVGSAIR